jgi:hypothetical protein
MRAGWSGPSTGEGIDSTTICARAFITCPTVTVPATNVLATDVLGTGVLHCHLVPQNRSWLRTQRFPFPSPFATSSPRKFQNTVTGLQLFILYRRVASQWCQGRLLIIYLAVEAAPQNLLNLLKRSSQPSSQIKREGSGFLCLPIIGNHPRRTPTSHLHYTLNIQPIPILIHRLIDIFRSLLPHTPTP